MLEITQNTESRMQRLREEAKHAHQMREANLRNPNWLRDARSVLGRSLMALGKQLSEEA